MRECGARFDFNLDTPNCRAGAGEGYPQRSGHGWPANCASACHRADQESLVDLPGAVGRAPGCCGNWRANRKRFRPLAAPGQDLIAASSPRWKRAAGIVLRVADRLPPNAGSGNAVELDPVPRAVARSDGRCRESTRSP